MSIVNCPQCGNKISTLAPICDHCGYSDGEASVEALQRFHDRKLRDQIYRLKMVSYAFLGLAILAFAWYWIGTGGFQLPLNSKGPYILMLFSVVAYFVVRILLFRAKRQKKANSVFRH